MTTETLQTKDFGFDLPEELIAQTPIEPRDASRLMLLDKKTGAIEHKHFYDIVDYLNPGEELWKRCMGSFSRTWKTCKSWHGVFV